MNEPRYTADDLDALNELSMLTGYQLLEARITAEVERRRRELERQMDEVNTAWCRGQIAALRTVLALPEIMREEMGKGLKEKDDGS